MNRTIKIIRAAAFATTLSLPTQTRAQEPLTIRQQDIAAVASSEAKGDMGNLQKALFKSLDDGMTVNELKEVITHLYAYTGFPRSLNAMNALQQVVSQRQAQGINDPEGREASPLPDNYDALRDGTQMQTKVSGGAFTYTFAPTLDTYLKTHLFGDIFANDLLTPQERELATVCALASMEGVAPQLMGHVAGARNMGLSSEQLHAIPQTLEDWGDNEAAYRAKQSIATVFRKEFDTPTSKPAFAFPEGFLNEGFAQYFTGKSWVAPLSVDQQAIINVTFEPGCRNNWHIHHGSGQILICVRGNGWYQEWGKPAQALKEGDVVSIMPGVKHWHGAAKDSWFQHVSVEVPGEANATTEWLEAVSDEEYENL